MQLTLTLSAVGPNAYHLCWTGARVRILTFLQKEKKKKDKVEREWVKLSPYSVQFSCSVVSDSLQCQGLQYARLPCPSPTPRGYSNSRPSRRWCHPTISSSVIPFSSCLQSFPASRSFPMSQFFTSGWKILEFQLQHQSFQWIFRTDFL